ncbi:hypothetical protein ACFWZ3_14320 [Frateuria sp. GZRR35]|uniref:hypothetical protein n=1 Tax=unclassified Frateuria TaxID=2648894 RepID=UPI003EDC9316
MTATYLLLSTLASLGFYLASTHQRLWPGARTRARGLRFAAWAATALAVAAAILALGPWAGVFASLTALMLVLVLLPYLDAWWSAPRGDDHVG